MGNVTILTEERPLRLAPDLQEALDEILGSYGGKRREIAKRAVLKVYGSGAEGTFAEIVEGYREAIVAAVKDGA
jgi:hypothetical protein